MYPWRNLQFCRHMSVIRPNIDGHIYHSILLGIVTTRTHTRYWEIHTACWFYRYYINIWPLISNNGGICLWTICTYKSTIIYINFSSGFSSFYSKFIGTYNWNCWRRGFSGNNAAICRIIKETLHHINGRTFTIPDRSTRRCPTSF